MYQTVEEDIRAVVDTAQGKPVKSILEVAYLTDDEIRRGAELAVKAGVTYVKTGTGWANKPTTVDTIRLLKSVVGDLSLIHILTLYYKDASIGETGEQQKVLRNHECGVMRKLYSLRRCV